MYPEISHEGTYVIYTLDDSSGRGIGVVSNQRTPESASLACPIQPCHVIEFQSGVSSVLK